VVPSTLPIMEADEEADDAINFSNSNHIILKRALIKHFQYAYTNGNILWPKQFSKTQKKKMPLLQVKPFLLFIYGRLYGNRFFYLQVAVNRAETLMQHAYSFVPRNYVG